MNRNILIILLTICFLSVIIAGCAKQKNSSTDSNEISSQTSTSSTNSSEGQIKQNQTDAKEFQDKEAKGIKSDSSNTADVKNETEQYIINTFNGSKTNDEDTKKILNVLGKIDWKKYDQVSKGKAFELSNWLYSVKIENENDILSVINATNGLDGAIAEGYSGIVAKIFTKESIKFIKCLTRIEEDKVYTICSFIAYGCGNNGDEEFKKILSNTKRLLDSNQLNDKEKKITKRIIKAFESVTK